MMPPLPVPCPLRDGKHFWIWPGGRSEGWLTAHAQATRALDLGATGVIVQASLLSPAWLQGRDPGDSVPRVEVFQQAGLQVTAGLGMDSSTATAKAIIAAILLALSIPGVNVMADWEKEIKWETPEGRALAKAICDGVLSKIVDAFLRCVECPWWKPNVHSGAPNIIFWALFRFLFCQDYGAHGPLKPDDTLYMLAESRREYSVLGIPPQYILCAAQMYQHSMIAAGRILLSGERVMAFWDVEEADAIFKRALYACKAIAALGYDANRAGLAKLQATASLKVTGDLDDPTLALLHV